MAETFKVTVAGGIPLGRATNIEGACLQVLGCTSICYVRSSTDSSKVLSIDLLRNEWSWTHQGSVQPKTVCPSWMSQLLRLVTAQHPKFNPPTPDTPGEP